MGKPWHHMHHGHGPMHHVPAGILIFPTLMVAGSWVGVMIAKRMLCVLQTIAETNALRELGDRLSETERAELERRVRDRLFECGMFGCCHR